MKENIAEKFKAIGDMNRLKLLELIIKGESCGCTLIDKINVTQPTMHYHINILEAAGIVVSKKEGKWRKLDINKLSIDEMIEYLITLKKLGDNR
ncbi:MAG: metalloregulator ArsR/SmtB family transcription factor [Candidatus Izemoplasmatales bacterium]|jgi:ArsR family transcriptional regulator|nr:metalloregulator ArsR/SmtB family transcription factor [Candidatus Izemoplasmatales bacterium]